MIISRQYLKLVSCRYAAIRTCIPNAFLEDRGHEIALTPGAVVQIDYYSDEQVAEWDREDQLTDEDRQRITNTVARGA